MLFQIIDKKNDLCYNHPIMSEIESNTINSADDEISLIDLFSVLIRHRMMIIIGTAAAFVLTGVYLFLVPVLFPKSMTREITVQYNVTVASVPGSIAGQLPGKVSNLKSAVNNEFSDPVFLVKELKKNNPFVTEGGKPLTDVQLNQMAQDLLKDKKIAIRNASIRDEVTFRIPEDNLEIATKMVDSMVVSVNSSIEGVFLSEVEKLKKTRQETYNEILKAYSENSNISDAQSLMLIVRQIDDFMQGYTIIAERDVEPFVVLEPLGRVKKLIIATFAAFFIFVFLAFLNNAIYNIKKDPEASGKIKAAWDNGKLIKK